MEKWFLATTKGGGKGQLKVENALRARGFEILSPMVSITKLRDGKQITTVEFAFPNYVFIKFNPLVRSVSKINNTPGIKSMVKFGEELAEINNDVIVELIDRFLANKFTINDLPQSGNVIPIKRGRLSGYDVIFLHPDGHKRSMVMLQLLGGHKNISILNEEIS